MTITQCDQCHREIPQYTSIPSIELHLKEPRECVMHPPIHTILHLCSSWCLSEWAAHPKNRRRIPMHVKGVN